MENASLPSANLSIEPTSLDTSNSILVNKVNSAFKATITIGIVVFVILLLLDKMESNNKK